MSGRPYWCFRGSGPTGDVAHLPPLVLLKKTRYFSYDIFGSYYKYVFILWNSPVLSYIRFLLWIFKNLLDTIKYMLKCTFLSFEKRTCLWNQHSLAASSRSVWPLSPCTAAWRFTSITALCQHLVPFCRWVASHCVSVPELFTHSSGEVLLVLSTLELL